MANSTSTQILVDGPRNVVIKFEGVLDTSDLGSTVVADPATLDYMVDSTKSRATKLRIDHLIFAVEDGLSVNLFWDATTPVRVEELVGRGKADYHRFGGLQNNAGATGFTGKITATTEGWGSGIKSFTVILHLVKQ